jgi:prepilin-type N-terminal cleavage/methylation domain-containing protein
MKQFHPIRHSQQGFTLLELLVASTVFSIVLLTAASVLIQISRMYYKGLITSRTQGATRSITDNLSRDVQFGGAVPEKIGPVSYGSGDTVEVRAICIDKVRYSYAINAQVKDSVAEGIYNAPNHHIKHALWQDLVSGDDCAEGGIPVLTNSKELLDQHMRLTKFDITPSGDLWNINVGIAYGDDEIINFTDAGAETGPASCKGLVIGAQWCAFSELSSKVYKRLAE